MVNLNRVLVYTHKFDKWEYVQLQNPNSQEYTILDGLDSTQKKVLNYVSDESQETVHYYQNGYYYQVVSTPNDLLQHIAYTQKDNRKHEMNRGFYEYTLTLGEKDYIPMQLFELAMQLYIDGKSNCEVDLTTLECFYPNCRDEYIAKFLYITNELLGLNLYFKVPQGNAFKEGTNNKVISFQIIDTVIDKNSIYLTYLNILSFNTKYADKLNITNESINSNTLRYILNAPQTVIEERLPLVKAFYSNCGISITLDNISNYVENYSIKNSFSKELILNLPLTLENSIQVITNSPALDMEIVNKYHQVVYNTPLASLKNFLPTEENQTKLTQVYEITSAIEYQSPHDWNAYITNLKTLELTPTDTPTLILLIKSLNLPKEKFTNLIGSILIEQYTNILSLENVLLSKCANLFEVIHILLNYEYFPKDATINLSLRRSTQIHYKATFRKLMDVNLITMDNSKKLNFMEKVSRSLDTESFTTLTGLFKQLFALNNENLDFSNLTNMDKTLILCTPELLLKYIEYCDTLNDEKPLTELLQEDSHPINLGLVQILYINYILYTLFEDSKYLTTLELPLPVRKYKAYIKRLKKFFEGMLRFGEIDTIK